MEITRRDIQTLTDQIGEKNGDAVLRTFHLADATIPAIVRVPFVGPSLFIHGDNMTWTIFSTGTALDTAISVNVQVHGFSFSITGPSGPAEMSTRVFQF